MLVDVFHCFDKALQTQAGFLCAILTSYAPDFSSSATMRPQMAPQLTDCNGSS